MANPEGLVSQFDLVETLPYQPPVVQEHLGGVATAYELLVTPPTEVVSGDGAAMLTEGTTILPNGGHKKDFDP